MEKNRENPKHLRKIKSKTEFIFQSLLLTSKYSDTQILSQVLSQQMKKV